MPVCACVHIHCVDTTCAVSFRFSMSLETSVNIMYIKIFRKKRKRKKWLRK